MKTSTIFYTWLLLAAILFTCKPVKKEVKPPAFNKEHAKYISSYTSGLTSRTGSVFLRFSKDIIPDSLIGKEIQNVFEFSSEIKGKTTWYDRASVEFIPEKYLESGKVYNAKVDLSRFFDTIKPALKTFPFQFFTAAQKITVMSKGLVNTDPEQLRWNRIEGSIFTEENEYATVVGKTLKALSSNGNELKINWHQLSEKEHLYTIDSVERKDQDYKIILRWNGAEADAAEKGEQSVEIPAVNNFKVLSGESFSETEQLIEINFSDPLARDQELAGLITSPQTGFEYVISNNIIKAYPTAKLNGILDLYIFPGIKNILGQKLKTGDTISVTINDVAPKIREVGGGNIIPAGTSVPFPFEAININAVDIRVTKIYENNVLQFLQGQDINDNWGLSYVGKVILEKKIPLNNAALNLAKWNRHAIDLSKLIKSEPGALYHVELRFRKEYSLYQCAEKPEQELYRNERIEKEDEKFWDYYDNWKYEDESGPCSDQYFRYDHQSLSRNILASDLGIVAKWGTDNKLFVAVTDLETTNPLAGIAVDLYDFQKQKIKTVYTNDKGFATEKTDESPFIVVARKGNQKGYLKLEYQTWTTDKFDVSGTEYNRNLKGFIYGDRGVWRPGDSIFISFILEDRQKVLPDGHPVVFNFYNPRGYLLEKRVVKKSVNGFYTFPVATADDAPTGLYLARIDAGGVTFEKNLRVETIIPNRLKIELTFDDTLLSAESKRIGILKSRWLHGAPAGGMKTDVSVTLRKTGNIFPAYRNFVFEDPLYPSVTESKTIFEGTLDKTGSAEIPSAINVNNGVPGVMKANFYCKVFEPGGNFSTDNFSAIWHPYKKYIGIKAPTGTGDYNLLLNTKEHAFEIITIDKNEKPIDEEITVELYRLEWKYWWEYYDDLGSYNGKYFYDPIKKETVKTKTGKGIWKLPAGHQYGRYMVRACYPGGHCTGVIVSVTEPGWHNPSVSNTDGTTMLTISSDKVKYVKGEKATLEIPTGFEGRALITIENGAGVLKADWVTAKKGKTFYSFTVTQEMAPNIYASVMLLQPQSQKTNDLSLRMYGIIPVAVDNPSSHLSPVISMPSVLRPEEKVTLKISEENEQAMTYTIAMTDEGLLDLTKFKTPDPWKNFYARQALQIKTWDMFDFVMGNHTSKIKKLLSIGGDQGDGEPGKGSKLQRFKPMVKFLGPFHLEAGKIASHTFTMPEYIGSVRTMVVAANNIAYGNAEITRQVKKPLMVLATLPRVLRPGEEVSLPVSVFAEQMMKEVSLEIKTNEILEMQSENKKTISFNAAGEQLVTFGVKVKNTTGIAKVNVIARSGNEKADYEIALNVVPANPSLTYNLDTIVKPGKSSIINYESFGLKGTNSGSIEISSMPSFNLDSRLQYLIQYPHGCVEQTTSGAFPQLVVSNLVDLTFTESEKAQKNIRTAISRLLQFQQPDGGLSYWPQPGISTEWGTSYAGHFLLEASARGYNVNASFLEKWKNFQRKKANTWTPTSEVNSDLQQAYRLYLLATAGSPETGAMNRFKELLTVSPVSKFLLAAAYQISGQSATAKEIAKGTAIKVSQYRELSGAFGSEIRDEAMILEALCILKNREQAAVLAQKLGKILANSEYLSTQETAFCLIALARFYNEKGKAALNFSYRINNGQWKKIVPEKYVYKVPLELSSKENGQFEIRNEGNKEVFVNRSLTGIPNAGNEKASASVIALQVTYKNMQGKPLDINNLAQGTDFVAEIKVTKPNDYGPLPELALSALFPSGWQIHNPRMNGEQFKFHSSVPEYMDIRDDRIYYYFDLNRYNESNATTNSGQEEHYASQNERIFRVALNASYCGRFYLPSTSCEAMYDHRVSAVVPGKWINVVKNQNQ